MQEEVYDENGVRVNYDPKGKEKRIIRKIRNVIPLACVLIYLVLGLFFSLWGYGALIFLLIPISAILLSAIGSDTKKKVMLITLLICILIYVAGSIVLTYLGVSQAWLKMLITFIIIPIVSTIIR